MTMRWPARRSGHARQVIARMPRRRRPRPLRRSSRPAWAAIAARSEAQTYSAWAPNRLDCWPKTSSPTPTPARPRRRLRLRRPARLRAFASSDVGARRRKRHGNGSARRAWVSVCVTVLARTQMGISSSFGMGRSTSSIRRNFRRPITVLDDGFHAAQRVVDVRLVDAIGRRGGSCLELMLSRVYRAESSGRIRAASQIMSERNSLPRNV